MIGFTLGITLVESSFRILGYTFLASRHKRPFSGGSYKILCFGDSLTYGQGAPEIDTYPKILEKLLNDNSKNTRFEVTNLGVPGFNSTQVLKYLEKNIPIYQPDFVIIMTGINDNFNVSEEYFQDNHALTSNNISPLLGHIKEFFMNLRVIKFVKIFFINLKAKIQKNNLYIQPILDAEFLYADETKEKVEISKQLGFLYLRQRDYKNAIRALEDALKYNKDDISIYNALMDAYLYMNKYAKAINILEEFQKRFPESSDVWKGFARVYEGMKEYIKAEDAIKKALKISPEDIELKMILGNLYKVQRKDEGALALYREVLETKAGFISAVIAISWLYHDAGKNEEAIKICCAALKDNPNNIRLLHVLSGYYLYAEDYARSIACLNEVLKIDPQHLQGCIDLGVTYQRLGDTKKALEMFKRALDIDPENSVVLQLIVFQGGDDKENFVQNKLSNTALSRLRANFKKELREKHLKKNLIIMTELARSSGITLILMTYPVDSAMFDCNNIIKEVAGSKGAILIDNLLTFREVLKSHPKQIYFVDSLHCNAAGYRMISQNIFNKIKERDFACKR